MVKIKLLSFPLAFFCVVSSFSQNKLFMPAEYQKAYKAKTRSYTGNPGENYWQNFASYEINATISPGDWKIIGSVRIDYTNNSPDTLSRIVIKAYPDLYKKGSRRLMNVYEENVTQGMELKSLIVSNDTMDVNNNNEVHRRNTVLSVKLNEKLPPGKTLELIIDWETLIPQKYDNRMGAYDSLAAFMAYWYPQVSVYDDIDGWDVNPYLGLTEFFREFSDYDVYLTLPASYNIWATGELQNPAEVYSESIEEKWEESKHTNEKVTIILGRDSLDPSDSKTKTWHFKAKNVIDFAVGMSNYFRWEASSVELGNKRVLTNLVYDPKDSIFMNNTLKEQNRMLHFFSDNFPGVTYPYPQFTTFIGVQEYDGMEFPMIVNDGVNRSDTLYNIEVTAHEMAHTYLPFYVGSNEVKYDWMDEGWTNFTDFKYILVYHSDVLAQGIPVFKRRTVNFSEYAELHWNIPLFTPSHLISESYVHWLEAYIKPEVLYRVLEDVLGPEVFKKCYKTFINVWKGKHPTPYDFFYTFEKVSNKNLEWLWNPWVFEFGYPDLALANVDKNIVTIQKVGKLPIPFDLKITYTDGKEKIIHRTAEIWANGKTRETVHIKHQNKIVSLELLTKSWGDADTTNNSINLGIENSTD